MNSFPKADTSSCIGIDRGITAITADSEGTLVAGPRYLKKKEKLLARAQRKLSRKQKGSSRSRKLAKRISNIHRKVRSQRHDFLHRLSTTYAKSHGSVVIEKLETRNLVRGSCSKGISDSGWGKFAKLLSYKLTWREGQLIKVDAKGTSQTCSQCKHRDSKFRNGILFHCTGCGFIEHADINAAVVIKSRRGPSALPVEGHLEGQAQGSGKVKMRRNRRNNNKKDTSYDHNMCAQPKLSHLVPNVKYR
jgi:putative transposase